MKISVLVAAFGAAVLASVGLAQSPGAPSPPQAPCAPQIGDIKFICGQGRAEDMLRVPNTQWVVASWLAGGVVAIGVRDKKTTVLYPSPQAKEYLDSQTYGNCPGAPTDEQQKHFSTAGLALHRRSDGRYTLYAVHYGQERALDVFALDARGKTPFVTWIGCVLAPDPIGLDAVVALPDGNGFIGTNWLPRGPDMQGRMSKMMSGQNNAEVWEWHTQSGWKKLPGSESSGPNGVDISKDGKEVFIDGWGSQSFIRLSRGATPPKRDEVPLGFRIDNIHWDTDGMIIGAGQGDDNTTHVVRIDPRTLKVTQLLNRPNDASFGFGTTGLRVGNELWVSSYRFDRIAVLPFPKPN